MADILTELFATFSSQEQAQIRAAEASAKIILAQGDRAVRERVMGSLSDRDYILTPRDEARAGAACAEFVGYQRVLNGRADPLSRESVQEFLGQLDKVCEGVLKRYGYHEGKLAIDELRAEAERLAWESHAKQLAATKAPEQLATAVPTGASAPQVVSSSTESKRAPAEEYAEEQVYASSKKMDDSRFSGQHKAQFRELLATGIELHANNLHLQKLDFGPWSVMCDRGDSQTKVRLRTRFRAAARKAASAAGAPYRVNLLDWWISKLARGQRRSYLEGLIQLSIEYCEELESNAFELRPLIQENSAAPGLNRDRYPCDRPIPYWLYREPHSPLADPHEEFAYWEKHIWQSFDSAVEATASLPRIRRRWVDENGKKHFVAAEDARRRVQDRVDARTELLDALILGMSYDVAVLQANYVIDRGFRGNAAIHKFEDESAELMERVRLSRRKSSKRLGLSWRKQDKRGVDLAKPFREVGGDLQHLASTIPANEFTEAASRESEKGPVDLQVRANSHYAGIRAAFDQYRKTIYAEEWAQFSAGDVGSYVRCYEPAIKDLVSAYQASGGSPKEISRAVLNLIKNISEGEWPPIPATWPWQKSELWNNAEFVAAMLAAIETAAGASQSPIEGVRRGVESPEEAGALGSETTPVVTEGAMPMGRPIRSEVKKAAEDAFAVASEDILVEHEAKKSEVLDQVRLTHNSGGYLPALTKWGEERLRKMVLAYADASVDAFTLYGVPSDVQAEQDLQTAAQMIAAGTISAIRGELGLLKTRTGIAANDSVGHLNSQVHSAMKSAVKKGVLRLRQQRIKSRYPESPSQRAADPARPKQVSTNGKRRGRRPDRVRRECIQSAITAHGDGWRDHLSDIFKELDSKDVPIGSFQKMGIDVGDEVKTQVSKWEDLDLAVGKQRTKIIDTLRKYTP